MQPFEEQLAELPTFLQLQATDNEQDIVPPYRLRFDILLRRARLVTLQEAVRMMNTIRIKGDPSQHAAVLMQFLRDITLDEAAKHIATLAASIMECEAKNLKRLEAEARLIQISFHLVINSLDETSNLQDIESSLRRTLDLCQTYPDTAGLLLPNYTNIKAVIQGTRKHEGMYTKDSHKVWWTWPKHLLGSLTHCRNGHPYSAATWSDCPECGREVKKPEPKKKDDPNDHLSSPADFMMTAMSSNPWAGMRGFGTAPAAK